MDPRHLAGQRAEAAACHCLVAAGLCLLERNARFRLGEWDLVMLDGELLVFVEVRLRSNPRFGGALASIDHRKRTRLLRAAAAWVQRHPAHGKRRQRFDVVGFASLDAVPQWVRDAWRAT